VRMTGSAVSLTVDDVPASSKFLAAHFGFAERMAADGFASLYHPDLLYHPDSGPDIAFLRRGLEVLPADLRERRAEGVIVAFVVDDLSAEETRLRAEGVPITEPIREEPWGERLFMVTDPNGIVYELVEWVRPTVIPAR
jgi:catechol 2,3-dioxygenase-like lactoylglutathione lyase family enzyme